MKSTFLLLMAGFMFLLCGSLAAQDSEPEEEKVSPDKFRLHFDLAASSTVFKLTGTSDVGNGYLTTSGSHVYNTEPVYKYAEERARALNLIGHFSANIPFYKTATWSMGVKPSIGLGYAYGSDDETALIFDLPQYLYYRNYKGKIDFTIFAGYKYTLAPLSYGLFVIGCDYNVWERTALRFYFSPFGKTYYTRLTNGDIKPLVRIREFGIVAIL